MIASLKAEFRKLFTVRSTYIIFGITLLALSFFAFYVSGLDAEPEVLRDPNYLSDASLEAINALAFILSLAGLLLMAHEYRYNTIMYTLTASKSRSRTLLAKVITVTCFAVVVSFAVMVFSPTLAWLGIQVAGHGSELVPQAVNLGDLVWRCLFFGWGYAMIALLLITIARNQIGAIVALFMVPITVEPLLSLLLKSNTVYLPFMALNQVLGRGGANGDGPPIGLGSLSPGKGAVVVSIYLVVGWIIAWILFLKRDAN
jgi:ABC-2 type transport system permease protein